MSITHPSRGRGYLTEEKVSLFYISYMDRVLTSYVREWGTKISYHSIRGQRKNMFNIKLRMHVRASRFTKHSAGPPA